MEKTRKGYLTGRKMEKKAENSKINFSESIHIIKREEKLKLSFKVLEGRIFVLYLFFHKGFWSGFLNQNTLLCTLWERLTLHGYARLGQGVPGLTPILLPPLRQIDLLSCDSALILGYLDAPTLIGPVVIYDTNPLQNILQCLPSTDHNKPYLGGIVKLHVALNTYLARQYVMGYDQDGRTAFYIGVHGVGDLVRWTWARSLVEAVASFARFSRIHTLVFITDSVDVPWSMWLPNLSHIRKLSVSCPRSEDILTALIATSPEDRLPFFPLLDSLALYWCRKSMFVDPIGLMKFVLYRYQVERPLHKLTLHQDEWEWFQQLDETWGLLIKSQCKHFSSPTTHCSLIVY